jgi:hypothetical protein
MKLVTKGVLTGAGQVGKSTFTAQEDNAEGQERKDDAIKDLD